MTLTLSCPEAARLALLEKDAFDFVGEEQTLSLDSITPLKSEGELTMAAMDDVRTLVFQVLRSQDISLSQRLKVIGRFCERLTELLQTHQTGAIPGLLLSTEAELESGDAMALLAGQEELLDVQAQIAAVIFVAAQNTLPSPHVQKVFREVAQGLGIQEGVPLDGPALISAYEAGSRRLAPALEAVPWLLEHYLCNEALVEVFPWGRQSPRRNYATLIIRFVIVRLMLVGRAAAHAAPLSPFELAETIQVGCRRYDHDANFNQNAVQGLVEAGWDSLERLYALI
jgi:lysine-N-methylase